MAPPSSLPAAEEEDGGGCVARWIRKEVLFGLALGQVVSLLITSTGFSSSELARRGINAPTSQSLLNYILLALVYGGILIYRRQPLTSIDPDPYPPNPGAPAASHRRPNLSPPVAAVATSASNEFQQQQASSQNQSSVTCTSAHRRRLVVHRGKPSVARILLQVAAIVVSRRLSRLGKFASRRGCRWRPISSVFIAAECLPCQYAGSSSSNDLSICEVQQQQ